VKYIKWRVNYNRPLSLEERQIAERLSTDPTERVARPAQSWHSALNQKPANAALVCEEEN
jgi:hypothetical protein